MATPIETNTQELREVLEQVYNLPDRTSGGSSEPDLVIGLDTSGSFTISGLYENITVDSESVVSTYNKLLSGETVNCVLNAKYHMDSGSAINASSPQIIAFARSEYNNSARVGSMTVRFNLWTLFDGFNGSLLITIGFDIHSDGTASTEYLEATKSVSWSSAFM